VRFNLWKLDFVRVSRYAFMVSAAITLAGVIALVALGLNYGIDFSSGTTVDVNLTRQLNVSDVEAFLDQHRGEWGDYTVTVGSQRVTIRFKDVLDGQHQTAFREAFQANLDDGASFEINTVGADIAREQQRKALWGIFWASLGILLYVTVRFELRFAVAAVISLLHVVFVVVSLFSLFRVEVNLPFIVAVLTILGYAINDTVVIFDRIRENLRFAKIKTKADLARLVNESIQQTLTRSITTVLMVLVGAVSLYLLGSESIRPFSLAIIIGLIAGAYSSIFIASPLWLALRSRMKPKKTAKAPAAS